MPLVGYPAATGLVLDFNSLTATGGCLIGSESEAAARDWLQHKAPGASD
jgi:hypothetical protein